MKKDDYRIAYRVMVKLQNDNHEKFMDSFKIGVPSGVLRELNAESDEIHNVKNLILKKLENI